MKYLLDTCVLSETVKNTPDQHVLRWLEARKPHELCSSAMALGELQRGVIQLPESKRRTELILWLQALDASFENRIFSFDTNVARVWAQITIHAEAHGKSMAAFDSIIAATAKAHDCILVTRNARDFANAGIEVLNPWE